MDTNEFLGILGQVFEALEVNLAAAQANLEHLSRQSRLIIVDGPHEDEPIQALKIAAGWMLLARSRAQASHDDLTQAHITISGLACR